MIFTVNLPVTVQVEEASKEKPYFGFRLGLDPALVASVVMESDIQIMKGDAITKATNVSSIDADLFDAVVRLVRLVEMPGQRRVLASRITCFTNHKRDHLPVLSGGQGARLSHILALAGDTRRMSTAIGHLREHFDEQLKMEDIARGLGMSVSGFHHNFRSITSMSPLQFQKHLRLTLLHPPDVEDLMAWNCNASSRQSNCLASLVSDTLGSFFGIGPPSRPSFRRRL